MLSNCGAGENSWESLGLQGNQTVSPKGNQLWILEGLMLKLKLQSFGHLIWGADSLEKTLMLGRIEGKRRRVWQKMRWLDSITDSMDVNLRRLWEVVEDRGACCGTVNGVTKSWTWLRYWTTATRNIDCCRLDQVGLLTSQAWAGEGLGLRRTAHRRRPFFLLPRPDAKPEGQAWNPFSLGKFSQILESSGQVSWGVGHSWDGVG